MKESTNYTKYLNKENFKLKNSLRARYINPNEVVDINRLLNRVRSDEKSEKKKKIIIFALGIFLLSLAGCLIFFQK
tara:strand:- start:284 stop:511 length:228 start_codon:yes stop_codon:yes gene_type:complete